MNKRALLCLLILLVPSRGLAQKGIPSTYDEIFRKYSKQYFGVGFDWKVFKAQAMTESNLNPAAKSWVGAKGLMQLMPATFQEVQSKNPEIGEIDDPRWNIAAGIYYDRKLWNAWTEHESIKDRLSFVLGSYNAGRGTILKAQDKTEQEGLNSKNWTNVELVAPKVPRWRYEETLNYVRRIQAFYSNLSFRSGFEAALENPEINNPEPKK
ncbi:MAG: transglycosylase SLT domain-containing protein [Terriglobia bacterium]